MLSLTIEGPLFHIDQNKAFAATPTATSTATPTPTPSATPTVTLYASKDCLSGDGQRKTWCPPATQCTTGQVAVYGPGPDPGSNDIGASTCATNGGATGLQQPSAAPTAGQYLSTNSSSNPPTLIWSSGGAGALGCGSVAPTVASCGTSPVQPANSTNCAGSFTTGTGAPGGCTMTFATAAISSLAGVPICMFWDNNAIGGSVIIYDAPTNAPTATDVLTFSAAATSHQIKYQCGWIN